MDPFVVPTLPTGRASASSIRPSVRLETCDETTSSKQGLIKSESLSLAFFTPPPSPTSSKMTHSKVSSRNATCITHSQGSSGRDGPPPSQGSLSRWNAFPYTTVDYQLNKKEKLGIGQWSDVYLAKPTIPSPSAESLEPPLDMLEITPPTTPTESSKRCPTLPPAAYAIKKPAMRSAAAVLEYEATILSDLSALPGCKRYTVPFHGLDARNGAVIMTALPCSLEEWMDKALKPLGEEIRVKVLSESFRELALHLLDGLIWLNEVAQVVHADIKPGNILLSNVGSHHELGADHQLQSIPVYADFSAAVCIDPRCHIDHWHHSPAAPVAGGTWDYLAPELLRSGSSHDKAGGNAPHPTPASDTYALMMTLLTMVIGESPFAGAPNKFLARDMAKNGMAFACATSNHTHAKMISSLGKMLQVELGQWFASGLTAAEKRLDARGLKAALLGA